MRAVGVWILAAAVGFVGCDAVLGVGPLPGLTPEAGIDASEPAEGDAFAFDSAAPETTVDAHDEPQRTGDGDPGDAPSLADVATPDGGAFDGAAADSSTFDVATGVCSPGDTQCISNTQMETCGAGNQWGGPTTCPYACVGYAGGACGGVCAPNAVQCAGTSGVETCTATGQWQTTTTCTGGQTCQSGACACPSNLTNCSGTCVNLATGTQQVYPPVTNCGACGQSCTSSCCNGHCC